MSLGHKAYMQVALESTYGTWKPAARRIGIISTNPELTNGTIVDPTLNDSVSTTDIYQGRQRVRGTIRTRLDYESWQTALWDSLFGTTSFGSTGGVTAGASPYTHEFKEKSLLNSLSIELIEGNIPSNKCARLLGAKVIGATVRVQQGEGEQGMSTVDWDIAAQSYLEDDNSFFISPFDDGGGGQKPFFCNTTNASTAVTKGASGGLGFITNGVKVGDTISGTGIAAGTTITAVGSETSITLSQNATATGSDVQLTINHPIAVAKPVLFHEAVTWADGSGDTPLTQVRMRSFELAIRNPVEEEGCIGQLGIEEPQRNNFCSVEFRSTKIYKTKSSHNKARTFANVPVEMKFGASSSKRITFEIDTAKIRTHRKPVAGYGLILETNEIVASKDPTLATALRVFIENTQQTIH